jgi:hypothetical protein
MKMAFAEAIILRSNILKPVEAPVSYILVIFFFC